MHTVNFKIECLALLPVSFWFVLNVLKSAKKRTIFSSHFNRGANQNKLHRPLQKPHAHVPTRSNRLIPISRASEPSSCHNLIIIILPPLEALCRVQFMHRKQKIYDNKLRKLTEERARKRLASAPNYKLRNLQQLPRNYNFAPRWHRKNETFFFVSLLWNLRKYAGSASRAGITAVSLRRVDEPCWCGATFGRARLIVTNRLINWKPVSESSQSRLG